MTIAKAAKDALNSLDLAVPFNTAFLFHEPEARMIPMEIEKCRFHEFLTQWNAGLHKGQRFGQAFYNAFNLHRLSNQDRLGNLYTADEPAAKKIIYSQFRFV